jgi:hypothetical protein
VLFVCFEDFFGKVNEKIWLGFKWVGGVTVISFILFKGIVIDKI